MHKVLLLGAGKIGEMIATFLSGSGDYDLRVGDADPLALSRLRRSVECSHDAGRRRRPRCARPCRRRLPKRHFGP